jgi:hypothetical protein
MIKEFCSTRIQAAIFFTNILIYFISRGNFALRFRLKVLLYFFWRARVCWPLLAYVVHFVFLRDVWIRTQRAAVASRRATNLPTHLPEPPILPPPCQVRLNRGIRVRNKLTEADHSVLPH